MGIKVVRSVEVIATEIPLPEGNIRFKLRKAPRGYETCLGYGPRRDKIDPQLNLFVNELKGLWLGKEGYDIDDHQWKEADKNELKLTIDVAAEAFKEDLKVSLYKSVASLKDDSSRL